MNIEDLSKLLLISMANQSPTQDKIPGLLEAFGKLTGMPSDYINFIIGKKMLSVSQWLNYLKRNHVNRCFLLDVLPKGQFFTRKQGMKITYRDLAVFSGVERHSLIATFSRHSELYRFFVRWPRKTTLKKNDVIKFVNQYHGQDRQFFIDEMIWQNKHNMHVRGQNTWDKILASINQTNIETFIEHFNIVVSNANAPKSAEERWQKIYNSQVVSEYPLYPSWYYQRIVLAKKISAGRVPSLFEAKKKLSVQLRKAAAYAKTQRLNAWARFFLQYSKPGAPKRKKLFSHFFANKGMELLVMLGARVAFGGMGSWNDVGLGDTQYVKVSEDLFRAIQSATLAVARHGVRA